MARFAVMSPAATSATPQLEPTHRCVRCGTTIPMDVALCERCNPLGLPQPASSQVHGTVFVGIVIAVIGLAILGRLALSGVGPFTGRIAETVSAPLGLSVTLTVTNEGSASGQTTCRISDPAQGSGVGPTAAYITSPVIAAGQTLTFSRTITELGSVRRLLAIACTGP